MLFKSIELVLHVSFSSVIFLAFKVSSHGHTPLVLCALYQHAQRWILAFTLHSCLTQVLETAALHSLL